MRQTLSKGMVAAAAATGILSLYSSSALADSGATGMAEGSSGVLSGNTVEAPVHAPINVCGNTVDVIGVGNPAFGNACVNEDSRHKSHDAPTHGGSEHDDGKEAHGPWDTPGHEGQQGPWDAHDTSDPHEASGASAHGEAHGSPGVGSGNNIQVPVNIPVNACRNSVDVVSVLNPAHDNKCVNATQSPKGHEGPTEHHNPPGEPPTTGRVTPPVKPPTTGRVTPPVKPPTTGRVTPPVKPPTTGRVTPPAGPPTTERVTPPAGPGAMAETGTEGLLAASATGAALIWGGAIMYRRSRAASRR